MGLEVCCRTCCGLCVGIGVSVSFSASTVVSTEWEVRDDMRGISFLWRGTSGMVYLYDVG